MLRLGAQRPIVRPQSVVGVVGGADPGAVLRQSGILPAWESGESAFAGGHVCVSPCGRWVTTGDILLDNSKELQRKLGLPTATFAEILTEVFVCHGPSALRDLRGMFAAAIFDKERGELHLIRDGVGARTLYYNEHGGVFRFATRLNALSRMSGVSSDLSLTALRNYLSCSFVPGDETMWSEIREVRPGQVVSFPGAQKQVWYQPSNGAGCHLGDMESHATRLRILLEDAVSICLPKNEPVGIYLSGGLDSSVVTALAARLTEKPIHTFAIHFGPQYPNELEFSSMVAQHCRTIHHIMEVPGKLVADLLIETMGLLDDPIGDPLTIPNLLLAREAQQFVSTTLNGEGGDPCFGGPKNLPMLLHELYGSGECREAAYFRSFQKCYDDLDQLLTRESLDELKSAPPQEILLEPFLCTKDGVSYLDQLMQINVQLKGADQILTKVNNLGSAAGLIPRSPLFDRRVVDMGFAIPPELKLSGSIEKAVLKAAAADLLPREILDRPKSGMMVPVQAWFRKELRSTARNLLLSRNARIKPYIRQDRIREWLKYEGCLWPRHGVKLWLVLSLEAWLRAQER